MDGKGESSEQRAASLPPLAAAADPKRRCPGGAHPPVPAAGRLPPPLGFPPLFRPSGPSAPPDRHPVVGPPGRPVGPGSPGTAKPRHPIPPKGSRPFRRSRRKIRIGRVGPRFPQMCRFPVALDRWRNGVKSEPPLLRRMCGSVGSAPHSLKDSSEAGKTGKLPPKGAVNIVREVKKCPEHPGPRGCSGHFSLLYRSPSITTPSPFSTAATWGGQMYPPLPLSAHSFGTYNLMSSITAEPS